MEGPHCIRYSPIGAVSRDLGEAGVDQLIYIGGLKGFGDRGAHKPGTPYTVSVVRDAGGRLAIVRGTLRIAGIDEAPGVDEDLSADLLGENRAVLLDGAGGGGGDAAFQIQVGGMFRADSVSSPPEHADPFPGIV